MTETLPEWNITVPEESLFLPNPQRSQNTSASGASAYELHTDDEDDVYDAVVLHHSSNSSQAEAIGEHLSSKPLQCFNTGIGGLYIKVHLLNEVSPATAYMPFLNILEDLSKRTGVFLVLVTEALSNLELSNEILTGITTLISNGPGSLKAYNQYKVGVIKTNTADVPMLLTPFKAYNLDRGESDLNRLHKLIGRDRSYAETLRIKRSEARKEKSKRERSQEHLSRQYYAQRRQRALLNEGELPEYESLPEEGNMPTIHKYPVELPPQHVVVKAQIAQVGSNNTIVQVVDDNSRSSQGQAVSGPAETEVGDSTVQVNRLNPDLSKSVMQRSQIAALNRIIATEPNAIRGQGSSSPSLESAVQRNDTGTLSVPREDKFPQQEADSHRTRSVEHTDSSVHMSLTDDLSLNGAPDILSPASFLSEAANETEHSESVNISQLTDDQVDSSVYERDTDDVDAQSVDDIKVSINSETSAQPGVSFEAPVRPIIPFFLLEDGSQLSEK